MRGDGIGGLSPGLEPEEPVDIAEDLICPIMLPLSDIGCPVNRLLTGVAVLGPRRSGDRIGVRLITGFLTREGRRHP